MKKTFIDYLSSLKEGVEGKCAIKDYHSSVSFDELYQYCGAISSYINKNFNLSDHCIGVLVDGSKESILLALGIVCSGNYYLPIDISIPINVLQHISDLLDLKVILSPSSQAVIPFDKQLVYFDELISRDSGDLYFAEADINTPLFAILTSGSTGYPKVLLKTHGAMLTYIREFSNEFHISSEDTIGNQIPFFSDAAQKDIYLTLYNNCQLVLIPQFYFTLPYALINYVNSNYITIISWVPSAYNMIYKFDIFRKEIFTTVRLSFWVGERIPLHLINYWKKNLPAIQYYNTYGMSELAGICCYYCMNNKLPEIIPIGQPLSYCTLAFYSDNRIQNEGELLISSPTLAVSMLENKGWKALDTINLLINGKNVSFYRTGDYGYIDSNKQYIITGRRDDQIKYHGYRIELSAMERNIEEIPSVREVSIIISDDRILAFIGLTENNIENQKNVKSFVKSNLPQYFQPHKYVFLSEIPKNRNGKKDKKQLLQLLNN